MDKDNIEDWLLLPSSDVSDLEDMSDDEVDELVFNQVFNAELERQVAQYNNLEELLIGHETMQKLLELLCRDSRKWNGYRTVTTKKLKFPFVEEEEPQDTVKGPEGVEEEAEESEEEIVGRVEEVIREEEVVGRIEEVIREEDVVRRIEEVIREEEVTSRVEVICEEVEDQTEEVVRGLSSQRPTRGRPRVRGGRQTAATTPYVEPRQRRRVRIRGIRCRGGRGRHVSPAAIWRKQQFIPPDANWSGNIPNATADAINKSPLDYFKIFIDDETIELFTEQSNLYAQQQGRILEVTDIEIKQFIGILLFTGITPMPQYRMFWANETRFPPVANVMSRDRFEFILKYLHVVDNTTRVPGSDRLFKVAPLLNHLQDVCRNIPSEQNQSVDEHMIPFKGTSRMKQYVKKKPKKWGYKTFMRCGASGLMHDFAVYVGQEKTCPQYNLGFSGDIVVHLCEDLAHNIGHRVFCDNWFTSIKLFRYLKDRGLWATGVVRADRTYNAPLKSDQEMKEQGRGSYDSVVDLKNSLVAVRWLDNKPITMLSAVHSVEPVGVCSRWSKKDNRRIEVTRPHIVEVYNESMGGVDIFGMLIALYRIHVRSRRGYMRIVHWVFNVSVVNGWLLYRRHMRQMDNSVNYTLLQFQTYIARALCTAGVVSERKTAGRPRFTPPPPTPKRGPKRLLPVAETRFDNQGHWPSLVENKGRCALCHKKTTQMTCTKCNVHLCLTKDNNCFVSFHSMEQNFF